jgi:hypothetical protein
MSFPLGGSASPPTASGQMSWVHASARGDARPPKYPARGDAFSLGRVGVLNNVPKPGIRLDNHPATADIYDRFWLVLRALTTGFSHDRDR